MLYTVSLERLDRWKLGRDKKTGKRKYLANWEVTDEDFQSILAGVMHVLGLNQEQPDPYNSPDTGVDPDCKSAGESPVAGAADGDTKPAA